MKRSPECRPRLWDGLVAAAVVALAAVTAGATWGGAAADELTAVVSVGGVEQERFTLDGQGEHIYHVAGYTLRVVETGEGVCVAASDCPTQDCVHTGTISRGGQSIVCLPARLSVTLTGGADSGVDAVIG